MCCCFHLLLSIPLRQSLVVGVTIFVYLMRNGFCQVGSIQIKQFTLDLTLVASFSFAWVVNFAFACAAVHEIRKMIVRRRAMLAPSQQNRIEDQKVLAVSLLVNASFFVVFSSPEIVMQWMNILTESSNVRMTIDERFMIIIFISRVVFSVVNCFLFAFAWSDFKEVAVFVFTKISQICQS